jgi:hypothetical protein
MVLNTSVSSGENGISISGDGNTVNVNKIDNITNRNIPRSLLREICIRISNINIEESDYSIRKNSDWIQKFEYNNVKKYIEIFDEYSEGYDSIENVLKTIPDPTCIMKKMRSLYLKVKPNDKIDGDFILEQIFNKLKEEICNEDLVNPTNLYDEQVDYAIYLIMLYAFTKCKILEVVD